MSDGLMAQADKLGESIDMLAEEMQRWRSRALAAEELLRDVLRKRPGQLVVLRQDPAEGQRLRVDRVHAFARIEAANGDTVIADADAVRLACVAIGLELRR